MKKIRSINTEENGFTSLVVAFIFILVLSLLTVGFAQVARREQQNALDSQLTNQAYYAAEAGVNDIKAELPALIAAGGPHPASQAQFNGTSCLNSMYLPNKTVNLADDVSYTCAIVNLTPAFLSAPSTSAIVSGNYIFSTATALNQLTFSWGSDSSNPLSMKHDNNPAPSSCPAVGCFSPAATWQSPANNYPPVVQLSITPLGIGNFTRTYLIANTFTAMLYPNNGGAYPSTGGAVTDQDYTPPAACTTAIGSAGSINYVQDGYPDNSSCNGLIIGANYYNNATNSLTYPFSVTVNLAAATPVANESWLVHYVGYYGGMNSCIQAGPPAAGGACIYTGSSTTTQNFTGSQVQVDVTGKAKDVEKRIVEILPYPQGTIGSTATQNGLATLPYDAIDSGDTCKQFATNPAAPGAGTRSETSYSTATSPACSLGPP